MNYEEEQVQELEVLQSIYPDEFTILNETYPNIHFQIDIKLELDTEIELKKEHIISVDIQLPETYPDVAPILSLDPQEISLKEEESDSESEDEDEVEFDEHGNIVISKVQDFGSKIHFKDHVNELLVTIEEQIETDMLIGMQMCFALISTIKENCEQWFQDELKTLEKAWERETEKREQEEQAKFNGTKVTKESYLEWRAAFRNELKIDERDNIRRLKAHNDKLTGKQMFEQGVAGTIEDELEINNNDELSESMEKIQL
ncbi:hypothetical protein TBLA_0A04030 [Henningerozyma blattae CBS 6284]|uniref:RWD domain-containing protein n=1 Tax=Henningerozyma blattae (strain ATCC 34711 / CBS 6284 / DSM 70876 / NBRC 10599 / NRRL Y-10934 / UCD 77-7) TaxID=1071380 RepID=I2GVP7_HENB6|nr:hypothetical protein TBLA_0A04030 [Tetrapisispora blattae CBS 6284]CCH58199.1 hypothetical protein TBLA_0A04030 [Tetrapisispora blattae CBS 6284]